jgi:hypothetical protein
MPPTQTLVSRSACKGGFLLSFLVRIFRWNTNILKQKSRLRKFYQELCVGVCRDALIPM